MRDLGEKGAAALVRAFVSWPAVMTYGTFGILPLILIIAGEWIGAGLIVGGALLSLIDLRASGLRLRIERTSNGVSASIEWARDDDPD